MGISRLKVPMDFGIEYLESPSHGNLRFILGVEGELLANSAIMSFNSPVIKKMTIEDGRTTVDVQDFSKDAVQCFLEASYSGTFRKTSKTIFREIIKIAHVFDVTWLAKKCLDHFQLLMEGINADSYEEQIYFFNEAMFVMDKLKKRDYVDIVIRKFTTLQSCTERFVLKYLSDISSCSSENLEVILEMTDDQEHILVEVLINYLEISGDSLNSNCRHILEKLNFTTYSETYDSLYQRLIEKLEGINNPSVEDYRLIVKIFRESNKMLRKKKDSTQPEQRRVVGEEKTMPTGAFSYSLDSMTSDGATGSTGQDIPVMIRKKSPNMWLSKRKDTTAQDPKKVLQGNILGILNRITPQNFKELSVQMLCLQFDNEEKLEIAVEIIFEKAVFEPLYSQTYANLCKIMGAIKFPEEQNAKVSPFRTLLLNRIQREFFREKSEEDKLARQIVELQATRNISDIELEELMYQRRRLKQKMLGNIQFIGELFNFSMLSSKIIMSQCIGYLLAKRDEEAIECLAMLFSTVGLKLENECHDEMMKRAFEKSFSDLKDLGENSIYGNRIRFMIQDVVELRENNWVPRRIKETPQRIEDIHRQYAREMQQKEMEAAELMSMRNRKTRG